MFDTLSNGAISSMKNRCPILQHRAWLMIVIATGCLGWSTLAQGEVFELKTGNTVEGDVLKQQGEVLLVDIGVDVIKIPLAQIKSRRGNCAVR